MPSNFCFHVQDKSQWLLRWKLRYLFYLQDNTHVGPDVDVDRDEETKDVDVGQVRHTGREDTDEAVLPHA